MTIETPEQAEAAQQQMEEFARLAHDVKAAVERLKDAFCELADSPTSVAEALVQLSAAAATVANDGRAERRWRDENAALAALQSAGFYYDDIIEADMRSPKQVELRAKARGLKIPENL